MRDFSTHHLQTDCNLVMYLNAATVSSPYASTATVVTSSTLTTVTNTNYITLCTRCNKSAQKKHPDSNTWVYGSPVNTTTNFPLPVWATNTSTSLGYCNLFLSNEGQLTVNNTYAQTVWSSGGPPQAGTSRTDRCLMGWLPLVYNYSCKTIVMAIFCTLVVIC